MAIYAPEYPLYASGDLTGATDTANLTRAVRDTAAHGQTLRLSGDFILRPPNEPSWYWRTITDNPVYVCVPLVSKTRINAHGATFKMAPPATPYLAAVSPLGPRVAFFGTTTLNTVQGTISKVRFEGGTFDFTQALGALYPFTYAFMVTGIDHLRQYDITFTNSDGLTNAIGRAILAENTRYRKAIRCSYLNIAQGNYSRYETYVEFGHNIYDSFTEAIDFDGPCWDVLLHHLTFKNGTNEAQCIDTGGGERWVVSDIVAENTGAIFFVYIKPGNWPTYAQWLADTSDAGTPTAVRPHDMVFQNIQGKTCGIVGGDECFRVGSYRDNSWSNPPFSQLSGVPNVVGKITVRNVTIDGGFFASVNECEDLFMDNITLRNLDCFDDADKGAALVIRQSVSTTQTTADSKVSGVARDINIINSQGKGLLLSAPSGKFRLEGIRVNGYNLRASANTKVGVEITRLSVKGGRFTRGDVDVTGGVAPSGGGKSIDFRLVGSGAALADYSLTLEGTLSCRSDPAAAIPVSVDLEGGALSNPCAKLTNLREMNVPAATAPTTGPGTDVMLYKATSTAQAFFGYMAVAFGANIVGDAVNNSFIRAQTVSSGGVRTSLTGQTIDDVAHNLGDLIDVHTGGLPDNPSLLNAGDMLLLNTALHAGTGSTPPAIRTYVGLIQFSTK